jgi:hypothetical protein
MFCAASRDHDRGWCPDTQFERLAHRLSLLFSPSYQSSRTIEEAAHRDCALDEHVKDDLLSWTRAASDWPEAAGKSGAAELPGLSEVR